MIESTPVKVVPSQFAFKGYRRTAYIPPNYQRIDLILTSDDGTDGNYLIIKQGGLAVGLVEVINREGLHQFIQALGDLEKDLNKGEDSYAS
jgi:hypothetical protein